jgi:uncharacterized membrane protein YcaP (DUF421 family)
MITNLLEIVLRTSAVYIVVVVGLRLVGKRHVAQLSTFDLVLILLISNAVQNAMVGENSSLVGGIVAAATLFLINYLFSFIAYKFRRVDKILEGTPTLLVHNGEPIATHLDQEKITLEELEQVIREHGIESIGEVKNATMELDGTISVIPKGNGEKRIETFKHRKMKYQQRKT